MPYLRSPLLLWSASLVGVWRAVALALHQPVWGQQSSRDLIAFGAIKGEYFGPNETWRLVASQWLHVKAPHMLLNAIIIGGVGLATERVWGRVVPIMVALAGGTSSQALLILLEPDKFLSGASQAYMALCGFAMVARRISRWGLGLAWAGVLIGIAIDISADGHIKIGHAFAIVFGIAAGLIARTRATAA